MMKSKLGGSLGHGGSAPVRGNSIQRGGGHHERCNPEAGAGPMSGGLKSTSVAQGRASGAQPVPKPRPTTMTAGRNATAKNGEERPMRAPDQRLGKLNINGR